MEIPKNGLIDLHVHLDGSLSFDMARELAKMQGMEIKSEKALKRLMVAPSDCQDLNDYLTKFDYSLELLKTESTRLRCSPIRNFVSRLSSIFEKGSVRNRWWRRQSGDYRAFLPVLSCAV